MSYKSKIYIVIAGFVLLTLIMFLFVFGKLQERNLRLSTDVANQRRTLEQLAQEQKSYEQGKRDIESLAGKNIQPDELFSRDTRLVKEITTLEDLSQAYSLEMNMQIAGTAKDGQKTKSSSEILSIPYTLTLTGPFDKVLSFLDSTENLQFITPVKTIAISAQKGGVVKATISADFYIKQ